MKFSFTATWGLPRGCAHCLARLYSSKGAAATKPLPWTPCTLPPRLGSPTSIRASPLKFPFRASFQDQHPSRLLIGWGLRGTKAPQRLALPNVLFRPAQGRPSSHSFSVYENTGVDLAFPLRNKKQHKGIFFQNSGHLKLVLQLQGLFKSQAFHFLKVL